MVKELADCCMDLTWSVLLGTKFRTQELEKKQCVQKRIFYVSERTKKIIKIRKVHD